MKLLAVVALGGACETAQADQAPSKPAQATKPATHKIETAPASAPATKPAARPRVLKNGRPACGNVMTKSKAPSRCEDA